MAGGLKKVLRAPGGVTGAYLRMRALALDRRLRLKVLPPVIGPPFGLTIMDLPGRLPLPAKISIRVGKPINLRERLGSRAEPEDGYRLVTSTMQRTLTWLSNQRSLPVLG